MNILAGEIGKKAMDDAARNTSGDATIRGSALDNLGQRQSLEAKDVGRDGMDRPGSWFEGDMPGEQQNLDAKDMGRGDIDRPGSWFEGDMPGDRQSIETEDMGRGEAGRPGAGFDGLWDKQEARTGGGEKLGSSFEGDWDKRAEHEHAHIKSPETNQGLSEHPTKNESIRIPAINDRLEGTVHPDTGIPYDVKQSQRPDGTNVELVMPEFDSTFETNLDKNDKGNYTGTRADHEKQCNEKLSEAVKSDPKLADKLTKEQLEQIENKETPDGYTWHHDAEPGKMNLVDSKVHAESRHTGGYSVWGKDSSQEV